MERESIAIIYEPEQVKRLPELTAHAPYTLLALDREVEYLLEAQGIPFESASGYRLADRLKCMIFAERTAASVLAGIGDSFSYRGIRLATLFGFSLQEYLSFFLYYLEIFKAFSAASSAREWIVFPPSNPPPRRGGALARNMQRVVVDAATLAALHTGIKCTVLPPTYGEARTAARQAQFAFARYLYGFCLTALTGFLRVGTPQSGIRILASDYWHNIEGVVADLPASSITLLDRKEASRIPLSRMRAHAMRFVDLQAEASAESGALRAAVDAVRTGWKQAAPAATLYDGIDIAPVIRSAIDTIVADAVPAALAQIEGAFVLVAKADVVLLRASVSGQTHFAALALVAKKLGKPCIEVQHGLEYLGPGSVSGDHAAEFIATYGPAIDRDLANAGYESRCLIPVGSPRFDAYVSVHPDPEGRVVCIGPDVYIGAGFDTYDAEAYLEEFFAAMPLDIELSVRLRRGVRDSFFERVIARLKGSHDARIDADRTLKEVLDGARLLVSCYSTALLEALQCGMPAAFLMVGAFDRSTGMRHFGPYAEQGVLSIVHGREELAVCVRELSSNEAYLERSKKEREFMAREFRFDGRASERLASAIRRLIKESRG